MAFAVLATLAVDSVSPLYKVPVSVTVSPVSSATYRINGLTNFTGPLGTYSLTVNATNMLDIAGNAGTNMASSVLYVTDASTGVSVAYAIPWNSQQANAGGPVAAQLVPLDRAIEAYARRAVGPEPALADMRRNIDAWWPYIEGVDGGRLGRGLGRRHGHTRLGLLTAKDPADHHAEEHPREQEHDVIALHTSPLWTAARQHVQVLADDRFEPGEQGPADQGVADRHFCHKWDRS